MDRDAEPAASAEDRDAELMLLADALEIDRDVLSEAADDADKDCDVLMEDCRE